MTGLLPLWILLALLAGALLGGLGLYGVAFSLRKKSEAEILQQKEESRNQFQALAQQALAAATEQFLALAQSRLGAEQARGQAELDLRRQAVETAVHALSDRLKDTEGLLRGFEKDRQQKYGSLEEQLRSAVATTERLKGATDSLQALLSNSRARGQWGERMAEDILRVCGFQENIQYLRNKAQDTVATRPDYTFLLPDRRKFHMDVKFPLDNYMRMADAPGTEERSRLKAEFVRDARNRIREITRRDYINPDEKTLDYVLLFIPNEQVYGFLQEAAPGLLDEALSQKVVLCSPLTLYAMLCVIREAYDNFHLAQAAQEVVKLVLNFRQTYEKFRERFQKLGEALAKTSDLYAEVAETSHKRLQQSFAQIERVSQGREPPEPDVPERPVTAMPERPAPSTPASP